MSLMALHERRDNGGITERLVDMLI